MGIDAKMVIKYKGDRPSDDQLTRWSWDICHAIGAKHFWHSDGLPSAEYDVAYAAWHDAFKAHSLYSIWSEGGKKDRTLHQFILDDIGPFPKELRRAIDLTCGYPDPSEYEYIPDTHREPGKAYIEDSYTPVLAADGEWLLDVSVMTRYYGVDYERGDILTLCAMAEWIESNIPNSEVWYGGDSSGVCIELFDDAARRALRQHLYGPKGREYFNYSSMNDKRRPEQCGLCVKGEDRMTQYGTGANYIAVSCGGCGKNFETRDNGVTWMTVKES